MPPSIGRPPAQAGLDDFFASADASFTPPLWPAGNLDPKDWEHLHEGGPDGPQRENP